MTKRSITEDIKTKYVNTYLENYGKLGYTELLSDPKCVAVLYKDLNKTEVDGYPVASDYVDKSGRAYSLIEYNALTKEKKAECELRFLFLPYSHELYVGTTGSGKTTGCAEPQLRAISSQKNKPNLFITDPKGEIYERNVRHLRKNGYKVFLLNFKDITRSDRWNPMLELYDKKLSCKELGNSAVIRTGKAAKNLVISDELSKFNGTAYIEYDNKAFPNGESLSYYLSFQKDLIEAEISSLVNEFANSVIKIEDRSNPTWEYGAIQLLKGIVLCMLEEAANPESGFTKEMMTINNVRRFYERLRVDLTGDSSIYTVQTHPLLQDKSRDARLPLMIALDNAPNTMLSYCGVFDGATKDWFQGHIYAMTTGNTIDISADDSPFAIFVVTRDYEKIDYTVAGMFIDWVYRKSLERAEASKKTADGKPTTRPLHFLLDEFGNIPRIPEFENKIATSRSRNIWFHLIVQSYEQIAMVYDDTRKLSTVIVDNCNAQIFLGAQSRETKLRFSAECGKMWVPSLASTLSPNDSSLTEVAVVPISDLDLISEGEVYVKRIYTPVIKAQYIRSYVCAANGDFKYFYDKSPYDFSPFNTEPFNSEKFIYKKLHID